jgi:hypothetical protein
VPLGAAPFKLKSVFEQESLYVPLSPVAKLFGMKPTVNGKARTVTLVMDK